MTAFKIIQLLLVELIQLQQFLTMNCPEIPGNKKNTQFYGYWVTIDHKLTNNSINQVMKVVRRELEMTPNGEKK